MEESKYNKYSNMPIEEAIQSLKIQRQKLGELKEKQRYMVENDPNNDKLKSEFNKEWKEILGEISDIYALNKNINKINETSTNKVSSKDKNMDMDRDYNTKDEPTIDDLKGFLTDYNSESDDEYAHRKRMIRKQRKKFMEEKYFELMSRNFQNMTPSSTDEYGRSSNANDTKINKSKLDELIDNRDHLDFTTKGSRFLDDYDETGRRIVNNTTGSNSKRNSMNQLQEKDSNNHTSGPIINEDMLKDLNNIKEFDKAIQRANLVDDYNDMDMFKNRKGPSVGGAIRSGPMNYDFNEDMPRNPGYMMNNMDVTSNRNYNPMPRRNRHHIEPVPLKDLDDYIDVNNLRNGNGSSSGMGAVKPPINKNPVLGSYDMPPLDGNYRYSPSLSSNQGIMNSQNQRNRSPMRPPMATPTPPLSNMSPSLNNRGSPNMNGMRPMGPMGGMKRMNPTGMMSSAAAKEWNQLEEELGDGDVEDVLDSDIDDIIDNPKSKEFKGNKALKLLGVGAESGAINKTAKFGGRKGFNGAGIGGIPKEKPNVIPMSGLGLGNKPYIMPESSKSFDNIAGMNSMNTSFSPEPMGSFMSAPDKLTNMSMNMSMSMNNMSMSMNNMSMGNMNRMNMNLSGKGNNDNKFMKALGYKSNNNKPSVINTNPVLAGMNMSPDYNNSFSMSMSPNNTNNNVNASFMINNGGSVKGFQNLNSPNEISPIKTVNMDSNIPLSGLTDPNFNDKPSSFPLKNDPRYKNNNFNNTSMDADMKRMNDPHNKSSLSFRMDESLMSNGSLGSNGSGNHGHSRNHSHSYNNNSNSNHRRQNSSSNLISDRGIDLSRPRDPKSMRPEDRLDAIILPSLTVTMKQITIHDLTSSTKNNILTSGYLLKRSSSLFKKWKHRYFILCSDNLYCFASNQPNEKSLLSIPITKDAVVRSHTEENKFIIILIAVWYEFNIVQKEFYFQAINEEEMNLWVKQIKMAITVEKFKRTSLPKVPVLPTSLLENVKSSNENTSMANTTSSSATLAHNSISNSINSFDSSNSKTKSTKSNSSHPNLLEEATFRNSRDYDMSFDSSSQRKGHMSNLSSTSTQDRENTSFASLPSIQAKVMSNPNEHRSSGLHQRINDIKMEEKHNSIKSNSNLSFTSSVDSLNDTNITLKNGTSPALSAASTAASISKNSVDNKIDKIEIPARISSNKHHHKSQYKNKMEIEKFLKKKRDNMNNNNNNNNTEDIFKHASLDSNNINNISAILDTTITDLKLHSKDLDFSDEEDFSIVMDEDFNNKSKLAENSFYIHSGDDEKSFSKSFIENSIDSSDINKSKISTDFTNPNYGKVIITEISRKDSDGADRFVRPVRKHHQRSRSEGSNLRSLTSLIEKENKKDNLFNGRSKLRSSFISVNSGDEEEGDLSMYQEILSSNKTNYRISRGNLTLKSDTQEKDETKDQKKQSSIESKSVSSYNSPSLSSQTQTQTEEDSLKKMDKLNDNQKISNDNKISNTKFDEKYDDSLTIDNESTIKYEKSTTDYNIDNSVTTTEEYFKKALSELAALSNLSKKK